MKEINEYWHDYYCAAITGLLANSAYLTGNMIHEAELVDDATVIANMSLKAAQSEGRVPTP